jgi:hypothetical protein
MACQGCAKPTECLPAGAIIMHFDRMGAQQIASAGGETAGLPAIERPELGREPTLLLRNFLFAACGKTMRLSLKLPNIYRDSC